MFEFGGVSDWRLELIDEGWAGGIRRENEWDFDKTYVSKRYKILTYLLYYYELYIYLFIYLFIFYLFYILNIIYNLLLTIYLNNKEY